MHCEFDEEFKMRVQHNFKLYVLLTSKNKNWKEDDILESIYQLNGYKNHKTVKYEMNSSHIHIKFDDERTASEAVEFLNSLSTDLTAVLVDDMLRDWFNYEMKSGHNPPWTLTIVDITGSPPLNLNFLTENILKSIFQNFGDPYLLPYTAALNERHVQVLFGSMTEALAACMAFGEWYHRDQKVDSFFFRVRINPSDKEALLIKNSGGISREAFKLDYFVNVRNGVIQKKIDSDRQTPHSKSIQIKAIEKPRKNKFVINSEPKHNFAHQVAPRTPILCVPVIATSNSYAEALMASTKKFSVDFSKTSLNNKKSISVSSRAVVDNNYEIDFYPSIQDKKVEKVSRCQNIKTLEKFRSISKKVPLAHTSISAFEKDSISRKLNHNVASRQKINVNKGLSRLVERHTPNVNLDLSKITEPQTAASLQQDY